ncbi:hypothetical protein C2S53_017952 [Perilla frutescens var. hirtella]|uniref:Uncharacterized protein n=1 Tax=Perilla frutescens var. hirtella TaxID=608512 RepID=A0AAD4P6A7_PERFH|nr:hypothetical protein C2S53_017952 [Perilla frutescens var. hirtella]
MEEISASVVIYRCFGLHGPKRIPEEDSMDVEIIVHQKSDIAKGGAIISVGTIVKCAKELRR